MARGKIATLFVQVKEICYSVEELERSPVVEEAIGHSSLELGVYPKAQVLNRFIAKMIDLLIDAAVSKLVPPIGVLAGLAYLLLADGFGGGRSVGKGSSGSRPSCPVPGTRQGSENRSFVICLAALPSWRLKYRMSDGLDGVPCSRWKGCWSSGTSRAGDWAMRSPKPRCWRVDSWMCRIERGGVVDRRNRLKGES